MESGHDVMKAFAERWLGFFPKPKVVIMDSAKSFASEAFHEFLAGLNVQAHYVAEKESWAHGVVEAVVQDVKFTASAIQFAAKEQDPMITLFLATSALNSTEYTAGFSSFQWAFGKKYSLSDEDIRTFHHMDYPYEFVKLVTARQQAEAIAQKTRARRTLSKLANTTVRQPLRTYQPMDLVKIWRRVWPKEQFQGPHGGYKKSGRPHWIGRGRVVFHEILPHQEAGDHRRHIVWVVIGSQLFRCSVHSVRPVTETEKFKFESAGEDNPSQWRSLEDVLPRREYYDLVDHEPDQDEVELPDLPLEPDSSTVVKPPTRRVRFKTSPGETTQGEMEHSTPGTSSTSPLPTSSSTSTKHPADVNDYGQPESKKIRLDDLNWVEALHVEAQEEAGCLDVFTALNDTMEFLKIEFDIGGDMSNRQRKNLERNPLAFMVKKLQDSEVVISRLSEGERKLFHRAKAKEVDSFLKNEAVRKCLDNEEVKKAYDSHRIVKARWVLTWKPVPPEDRLQARNDEVQNPETLHGRDGAVKAKARIVLLGFQHPNLLDPSFKTSSPVQSALGRNLLYTMSVQRQWDLEGLDLATAFLQTQPTEADQELWTTGVKELREALGVEEGGVMRILRNIYGSTTAPRGLWLDLHRTLTRLGAQPVLGERCLWVWLSREHQDRDHPRVIGAMGGHVDDFHRIGDGSAEWLDVKRAVDTAYKWGMAKTGAYRHAGADISTTKDTNGFKMITGPTTLRRSATLTLSRNDFVLPKTYYHVMWRPAGRLWVLCSGWPFSHNN